MSANYKLEGEEHLLKVFADLPDKMYRKAVGKAMKAAAVPVRTEMANTLPSELRATKKILKVKASRRGLVVSIGFTGGLGMYENRRGQLWDPYQLVYWHNYGTLSNRLSSHTFKNPRRRVSASWQGGIKSGQFVERAWENSKDKAQKVLEETWAKEILKMCDEVGA